MATAAAHDWPVSFEGQFVNWTKIRPEIHSRSSLAYFLQISDFANYFAALRTAKTGFPPVIQAIKIVSLHHLAD